MSSESKNSTSDKSQQEAKKEGFLDQMKKNHKNKTSYKGNNKAHLARKVKKMSSTNFQNNRKVFLSRKSGSFNNQDHKEALLESKGTPAQINS